MAFPSHQPAFGELDASRRAECVSVSFSSPVSDDSVRTGHPITARLQYRAAVSIPDVVFRISLYWPSGYLCAQLTNESTGQLFTLTPGSGAVEFQCPILPVVPGLYRVDVAMETNGVEIDLRQRCATLCVEAGKPVSGDFYIENTCSLRPESPDHS
jgi:hypothetical protein